MTIEKNISSLPKHSLPACLSMSLTSSRKYFNHLEQGFAIHLPTMQKHNKIQNYIVMDNMSKTYECYMYVVDTSSSSCHFIMNEQSTIHIHNLTSTHSYKDIALIGDLYKGIFPTTSQ